jgi:hypothetical protein
VNDDGSQRGRHAPKVGCWRCVERFVDDVNGWANDSGLYGVGGEPEAVERDPDVVHAFAAWAKGSVIEHGPELRPD